MGVRDTPHVILITSEKKFVLSARVLGEKKDFVAETNYVIARIKYIGHARMANYIWGLKKGGGYPSWGIKKQMPHANFRTCKIYERKIVFHCPDEEVPVLKNYPYFWVKGQCPFYEIFGFSNASLLLVVSYYIFARFFSMPSISEGARKCSPEFEFAIATKKILL